MHLRPVIATMVVVAVIGLVSLLSAGESLAQTATATPGPMMGTTPTPAPMMGATPMGAAPTAASDPRVNRQLMDSLKAGGYIIYFRHGATDRSQQDTDPKNLANCATQRNLNDMGRTQARSIGEAFRALNIPVGQVLSSEYCRALEHARHSFNRATPEPSLVLPDPLTAEERQRNTQGLQRLLSVAPQAGMNTVMVSHSPNLRDAIGVDLTVEGSAAILRPNAQGRPEVVAIVLPGDWGAQAGTAQATAGAPSAMPRTGMGAAMGPWGGLAGLITFVLLAGLGAWRLITRP
jgi:phosphohistidine phosphatase SixA